MQLQKQLGDRAAAETAVPELGPSGVGPAASQYFGMAARAYFMPWTPERVGETTKCFIVGHFSMPAGHFWRSRSQDLSLI